MICYKMRYLRSQGVVGLLALVGVGVLAVPTAASSRVKPRLGRPPASCAGSVSLQRSTPGTGWGQLVGTSPLWLGVYAHVNAQRARITVRQDRFYKRRKQGWPVKILWVIPRTHTAPIKVTLKRAATRAPVWIRIAGLYTELTKAPTLDPARPGHPDDPARPDTHEWGSTVYLPRAGCYIFAASWLGGSEGFVFAFGRRG